MQKRLQAWLDLFDAAELMARAGIRSRLPPGADDVAEYFRIVKRHSDEHQEAVITFAREFADRVRNARTVTDR